MHTKKISKYEALDLYNSYIKPDVDVLNKSTGKGKDKINDILEVLNDIASSEYLSVLQKCT